MSNIQLSAVAIVDCVSEAVEPKNLQVVSRPELQLNYITFDAVLQWLGRINRNNRLYDGQYREALNDPKLRELMDSDNLIGEAGHPIGFQQAPLARIATIDPKMASHKIKSLQLIGDSIQGHIHTLDNGLHGTSMTRQMLQGMKPSFSVRALTNIGKHPNGHELVTGPSRIVTFDWVYLPSHPEAYIKDDKPVLLRTQNGNQGSYVQESAIIPMSQASFSEIVAMESSSFREFTHMADANLESSFTVSQDGKFAYVTENTGSSMESVRYAVPIEQKVRDIAKDIMRGF